MKGKQLTLDEVLDLEDGSKVWVEDDEEGDKQIGIVKQEGETRVLLDDSCGWFDIKYLFDCEEYVYFYEWIEDNSNPMMLFDEDDDSNIINKMAQEICNLRGLDLTDDNIRLVIEEFSWQDIWDGV